jgi:hypothetical protein
MMTAYITVAQTILMILESVIDTHTQKVEIGEVEKAATVIQRVMEEAEIAAEANEFQEKR